MPVPDYIKNVCKIGQGKDCCRYLLMGTKGFECGKVNELKEAIDKRVHRFTAQADNCAGQQNLNEAG